MYTRLTKPSEDHGGFYRDELTPQMLSLLSGLGCRKTGKQPSAPEIPDKLIRLENQALKKRLTDLETNSQVLEQRYADLEMRLEAELLQKNDLSLRYAEQERHLEAELQEMNDLSVRSADLERHLEAELQEKNDLSVRYAEQEMRLEAELQEMNDLSVRYAYLVRRLEAELQEKNDLSVRLSAIGIRDGNTTIVDDLSDENRPTKLAEYFSELYENEWTDCFNELDSRAIEESESIRILLKILTDIFNACLQWSTEDYFLLVQRAIDRTYIGQADSVTDERPKITGTTQSAKESEQKCKGKASFTTSNGPSNNQQLSNADVPEDGSSDKRQESNTDPKGNEETQKTDNTEATIESGDNAQVEVPSVSEGGPCDKRQKSKADSESNEETPENTVHTQATIESGENDHGDAPSMKEDKDVLGTTYPAITAEESTEKDQSDEPFHDNTKNGLSSEDQHGSWKVVNQDLRDKDKLPPREKEEVELPKDLLQPIKEIKKRRALKVLPTIHEFVRRKLPTLVQAQFTSTYFQTYIQKCTEFSWLAVVQDPPLVLLADGGAKFDRKLFKEYMRRGQFVEFVVWPALLVEEGGAILSKGVAQGINKPQ